MMELKKHGKSEKHFIVVDPTSEAVARARELVAGGWAKVGDKLTVHTNYLNEFRAIRDRANRASAVVPAEGFSTEVANRREASDWLDANINDGKARDYFSRMSVREFNRRFAGKSASVVEEYGIDMTKEIK